MNEWAVAFALTLVTEVPLYVVVLGTLERTDLRRTAAFGVLVNAVTHPFVWVALHPALLGGGRYAQIVLLVEAAVVAIEAAMLGRWLGGPWAFVAGTALLANAASVLVGVWIIG